MGRLRCKFWEILFVWEGLKSSNISFYSQDLDTRIIIGSFSQEVAPKIFCEVSCQVHGFRMTFLLLYIYYVRFIYRAKLAVWYFLQVDWSVESILSAHDWRNIFSWSKYLNYPILFYCITSILAYNFRYHINYYYYVIIMQLILFFVLFWMLNVFNCQIRRMTKTYTYNALQNLQNAQIALWVNKYALFYWAKRNKFHYTIWSLSDYRQLYPQRIFVWHLITISIKYETTWVFHVSEQHIWRNIFRPSAKSKILAIFRRKKIGESISLVVLNKSRFFLS